MSFSASTAAAVAFAAIAAALLSCFGIGIALSRRDFPCNAAALARDRPSPSFSDLRPREDASRRRFSRIYVLRVVTTGGGCRKDGAGRVRDQDRQASGTSEPCIWLSTKRRQRRRNLVGKGGAKPPPYHSGYARVHAGCLCDIPRRPEPLVYLRRNLVRRLRKCLACSIRGIGKLDTCVLAALNAILKDYEARSARATDQFRYVPRRT